MNLRSRTERKLTEAVGKRAGRARTVAKVRARAELRPRLRARFREETRRAILAAAEAALVEHGVHGARMENIAKAAGIAVGTVYNYFADRDELVSALLDLRRREILDGLDTALAAEPKVDFAGALERYVATAFSYLDAHRALFRLLMQEDLGVSGKTPSKQTMLRELMLQLDRLMARGVAEGKLARAGSELYGALLLGMIRGVLLRSLFDLSPQPLTPTARQLVQFFLRGAREP
jgi:AcrR family transcriptional regulator